MSDALPDLVPFIQFRKREKHQRKSDTYSIVGTKLRKASHWKNFDLTEKLQFDRKTLL